MADLKKDVNAFGVFSIATGAMISSGIFILPGLAFAKVGSAVFISYFAAGVLGIIGVFSMIELSTALPKAGGDYYFINKTFGPMIGSISGFLGLFALSLKSAFAIFGISEIVYIYTSLNPLISGSILCILFVILNIIGVKEAAVFQTVMVIILLLLMVIYISTGFSQINTEYFSDFNLSGINNILITSGFIFISFGGLLKVANISEEVSNPKRNLPLGMITSIIVVTILYTLTTFVLTGTLSPEVFKESLTPVADSAKITLGSAGYLIIIIASTLAFFTTANAGILAASRYPLALSLDNLLPRKIGKISKKTDTPIISIILTGAIVFLSLLLPLETLVKTASTVILTSYVLTNLSVIIFRESKITNYRPSFKAPLYPWLQIFSILLFTFFIIDLGLSAIEISIALVLIGLIVYIVYGRRKANHESALLHLMKRIADERLQSGSIEDEFRDIIINRDNIEQDNFDALIKDADIVDIKGHITFESLLKIVVKDIADIIDTPADEIIERYTARQEMSNTAISEQLAIPHILIDGTDKMFMYVIRARDGIIFTETEDSVKAVFLLGGTKDRKVLHLKTIAAIASLVSDPDFNKKWAEAEKPVDLKNLLILNTRRRYY
ncbi:MAG TPA: amino acid permease-associated protein [Spirochaeta sp.]|nr:amino acid permease-associated protein [Spirochaeta sp.]